MTLTKQAAGFKFGQHRLTVLRVVGRVTHKGREYRVVDVLTHDGLEYRSIRLYNEKGHFIKQLLFEPELASQLREALGP